MKKHKFLNGIYPISPPIYESDYIYLDLTEKALKTDIKVFQFRGQHLSSRRKRNLLPKISNLCHKHNVKLIINDDIELLKLADGSGLHIGHDKDLRKIRKHFGKKLIIGISCYNSISKAHWAEENGADYVSFGACFTSKTKKNTKQCEHSIFELAKKKLNIPICIIGGINKNNIVGILKYEPDMVAIISGIFDEQDVESTTYQLIKVMKNYE